MPARLAPDAAWPAPPGSQPQVCSRPQAQPLRISGKVSQLGTLSFQPSMTAATIMAAQTKARGQFDRLSRAIDGVPPAPNEIVLHDRS